jgi:putative peptide zinc metalloprotease protein
MAATTTAERPASQAAPARPGADVLRRADGVELIGEFEGSGFREPPLLARRDDGQVVQLTELLYAIAEASDGQRDVDEVAANVGDRTGRPVNGDNVAVLAEKKLRPLGVLALADGTTPELPKREPVMALRHRKPLLSERIVNAGSRPLTWLHLPFVTVCVLLTVVAFDVWLFGVHGIAGALRSAIYNPTLLLGVLASVVVATGFHEFGHTSACRYGGGRPGVMGVGFYLVWPAFYCDVTDAYRLSRAGRLRTDLGGVYFNAIFALLAGVAYFATGEEAILLVAVLQHVSMLQQLLPLLRFDGYYVLTDLTGVPDILSRIKPIFRSLVPGRNEPRVADLKPWVRVVVTAYVLTLVPLVLFFFAWVVIGAPRLFATVHDSFGLQLDRIGNAPGPAEATLGAIRVSMLVLPVAATLLSVSRAGRALTRGLVNWSQRSIPRKIVAAAAAAALVGAIGYIWWPNGDYQPIRPGERGTVGEALRAIPAAAGGRPSFTPEYEQRFAAVPTVRDTEATRSAERRGEVPPGTADRELRQGQEWGSSLWDDDTGAGGAEDPDGSDPGGMDDYSGGGDALPPAPSDPTVQPDGTTTTEPAPTGTTPTEPSPTPPSDTTPTEPSDTTPTEPSDTTSTEPSATTPTEPAPDGGALSTAPTTETAPTAPDSTTTSPTP